MTTALTLDPAVTVVAREPAATQIRNKRTGEPIMFTRIQQVMLSNGRIVFGCALCDYLAASPNNVRPHMNAHRPKRKARKDKGLPRQAQASTATIADLQNRLALAAAELEDVRRDLLIARTERDTLRDVLHRSVVGAVAQSLGTPVVPQGARV